MKNLSHLREKMDMNENTMSLDGIVLDIQSDQFAQGESHQDSVKRTVAFFTEELPERLVGLINSNSSISSKLRGHLRLKKMDIPMFTKVMPNGEVEIIYEHVSRYFFDQSAFDLLAFITNEILEQTRFEIKNKQRRILILVGQEQEEKTKLKKILLTQAWQNVARQIPPPMAINNYNIKM